MYDLQFTMYDLKKNKCSGECNNPNIHVGVHLPDFSPQFKNDVKQNSGKK
jgi:hypothetical protein